jgi:hypothetical protein
LYDADGRGKKGKLKKMKEKYKDQDDEERQLKMQILQVRIPRNQFLWLCLNRSARYRHVFKNTNPNKLMFETYLYFIKL